MVSMNNSMNITNNINKPEADCILDMICEKLEHTSLNNTKDDEIDERGLLEESLQLKKAGVKIINATGVRYSRYLECIDVWEVNDICCLYIRDMIVKFLKDKTLKLIEKVRLMRYIDFEIMRVVKIADLS